MPTRVRSWNGDQGLTFDRAHTSYGFIISGRAMLETRGGTKYRLSAGQYFAVVSGRVDGGMGVVFERGEHEAMFHLGGPIEHKGRLRYIDGCSDTLLIPPARRGEACLNHLHFPAGISQTRHTHPTLRAGVVARGAGRCVVPSNANGSGPDVEIPLVVGNLFVIPPGGQHSFFTDNSTMDVIAFHPDSDTGPTDEDHPMVNRTYVDGVSASKLDGIRTAGVIRE